ncbi:MAG: DNA/RNA non-specific endonuclease [Bacteroidota bacterium]
MKRFLFLALLSWLSVYLKAQPLTEQLAVLENQLDELQQNESAIKTQIESTKLQLHKAQLLQYGLPQLDDREVLIDHALMALVYDEAHEQAKWVAHLLSSEITTGGVGRSNDFRPDPKVETGTTVEADFFLKYEQADGSIEYDGYGYDRGHLAPSADFRWSQQALSESYYYSNMSPQLPEFNRKVWAQLEQKLRNYIFGHPSTDLLIVTGPIIPPSAPAIARSPNGVSIPEGFFKVALDLKNQRGIAFLLPHLDVQYPLQAFAKSIDELEAITGMDFYHQLPDALEAQIESSYQIEDWLDPQTLQQALPIDVDRLPRHAYNTAQAQRLQRFDQPALFCGKVVSGRTTRKGNVMLNLDRPYPNEVFNIFIRKENLLHFELDPLKAYLNQEVCVYGKPGVLGETLTIFLEQGEDIRTLE